MYQSRADTCMLRYNRSTILKLYAITRHVKPPGAVIFSSDDLLLQLNGTEELKQIQNQQAVSSLKHPRMFKKLPKENAVENPRQLNTVEENTNNEYQSNERNKLLQLDKSFHTLTIPTLAEDPSSNSATSNYIYNDPNNYGRSMLNYRSKNRQKEMHEKPQSYQQQATLDDYDNYYDELNRPKNLNERYAVNRGVRSESDENVVDGGTVADVTVAPYVNGNAIPVPAKYKNKPETLWDLEMEKEEQESLYGSLYGCY